MALSRIKIWISGEVLTASDLNAEFNNMLNNPVSLLSPLTAALDLDGYAVTVDGAGVTSFTSTAAIAWAYTTGAKSGTPGSTGSMANWTAHTFTDTATAGSGTAASFVAFSIQRPTLAATNSSVTTTDAAVWYIPNNVAAGTNETITNSWALWVDAGNVRFDDNIVFLSGTSFRGTFDHANTANRTYTLPDVDIMPAGHATGLTANRIPYASGATGGLLTDSSLLTFDGTTFATGVITATGAISSSGAGISTTAGDVTAVRSSAGGNVTMLAENTNNANAASHARLRAVAGGASGGDALLSLEVSAATIWSVGVDNSDADSFKIGPNVAVGTSTSLTITTAGAVTGAASITATTSVSAATTITSTGDTSGIGYATGAGGTITQATSITTGVTLNKIVGEVVTVSASTGAGSEDTFTVTNSAVAANDAVHVWRKSYSGAGTPVVFCTAVGAGSFNITISNLHSADALNAAITIGFIVLKGVTA